MIIKADKISIWVMVAVFVVVSAIALFWRSRHRRSELNPPLAFL